MLKTTISKHSKEGVIKIKSNSIDLKDVDLLNTKKSFEDALKRFLTEDDKKKILQKKEEILIDKKQQLLSLSKKEEEKEEASVKNTYLDKP